MAESLFDIFGDHHALKMKNVTRQPFSNNENKGKMVTAGPIKPNEPMKKGEQKKSFLSNTGKALQSTPARKVFTPRAVNVASLIYCDEDKDLKMEEIEFTKPTYRNDNYKDLFGFLLPELELVQHDVSPPPTPPPEIRRSSMEELDSSYLDEDNFTVDFSLDSLQDDDLGFPVLY